jgi:hypothetical protein
MAKKNTSAKKMWVSTPVKPAKPTVPDLEKRATEIRCNALIERMKPQWIQPPREQWGYVGDVYGKWYRNYYYFCALYRYDSPEATQPQVELKFSRLEYAGPGTYNLAYFRHTGQWFQVFEELSLEACLEEVEKNPIFQP